MINIIRHSGLYDIVDTIYCYLSGEEDIIRKIVQMITISGCKFMIVKIAPNDQSYERLTLEDIHNHVDSADKILYIHSKGVSYHIQSDKNRLQNIDAWIDCMMYFLVKNHEKCIKKLDEVDTIGINFSNENTSNNIGKHWSGNFWWVRGDYFLTLPHKIGSSYCDPETAFIFLNNPRYYEMYNMGINCYGTFYEPYRYVDNS
jgi:hypothetical protein